VIKIQINFNIDTG